MSVKALELAGWRSMPLLIPDGISRKITIAPYHSLLSASKIYSWRRYFEPTAFHYEAEAVVRGVRSVEELLKFRVGAVRVGGHAVSTARRQLACRHPGPSGRNHSYEVD